MEPYPSLQQPKDENEVTVEDPVKVTDKEDRIVQYILVRTDLNWGLGATIAQACHASIASIASTINDKYTVDYLADLKNMHKIILRADNLKDLERCEEKLKEANIPHHTWVEEPEKVVSCLAVSPQPRSLVQAIFKHIKLLRK